MKDRAVCVMQKYVKKSMEKKKTNFSSSGGMMCKCVSRLRVLRHLFLRLAISVLLEKEQ